jgi:hypothetical protein
MRKRSIAILAALSWALAVTAVPAHASSIFINCADSGCTNSGDVAYMTTTPFSQTNNGITAHFSANATAFGGNNNDPDGFITLSTAGTFSWGPQMLITDTITTAPDDLVITFSQTLTSISMNFGTGLPALSFHLNAYLGTAAVGSNSATGTVVVTDPEGTIGFNAGDFNTVVLSSSSPALAVGNITVTAAPSSVPEPGYFWAFPAFGLGLAVWKRRGQTTRTSHRTGLGA